MALSITSLAKATLSCLPVCPPTVPNISAAARNDLPVPSPSNHLAVPSPNPIPPSTDAAFPPHSTPDFGKIGSVFKIPPGSYGSSTTTATATTTTTTTAATTAVSTGSAAGFSYADAGRPTSSVLSTAWLAGRHDGLPCGLSGFSRPSLHWSYG